MSVEVVMPQMGESITEGTVSKWLKAVGEKIEKDEPLLEISTDKVDAEVPSPSAGVLLEIRANEGETVEVNSVVGVLGEEGETSAGNGQPAASSETKPENDNKGIDEISEHPMKPDEAKVVEKADAVTASASSNDSVSSDSASSAEATEVVMPQMGESITEGTVSKWLKAVGDKIEKDEPLLEISTDKVDAEVPSPVAGTLLEIRTNEGETVEVGSIVGLVGAEGASRVSSQESSVSSQTSPSPSKKPLNLPPPQLAQMPELLKHLQCLRRKKKLKERRQKLRLSTSGREGRCENFRKR